jgi:penicillin-binding protein 1A
MEAEQSDEPSAAERIVDARTIYQLDSMLRDVVRRGTAVRARALGRNDLAGKTGTTNDQKDAWFSGFNPDLVATVWVGFDQPATLGRREYGGTAALPIWMRFMGPALEGVPENLPRMPRGLVTARIDPTTGRSAPPATDGAFMEIFKQEEAPPPYSELEMGSYSNGDGSVSPLELF